MEITPSPNAIAGAIDFDDAIGDKLLFFQGLYGMGISSGETAIWSTNAGGGITTVRGGSRTGTIYLQVETADADIADGTTALLVRRNVGGTLTLQPVSMGAADSGGAGFKTLRVPN